MGIDYCVCKKCDGAFPDVIDYGYCVKCDESYCGYCTDEIQKSGGFEIDEEANEIIGCPYCKGEIVSDEQLLNWLLLEYQVTKEELIERYKKHMEENNE